MLFRRDSDYLLLHSKGEREFAVYLRIWIRLLEQMRLDEEAVNIIEIKESLSLAPNPCLFLNLSQRCIYGRFVPLQFDLSRYRLPETASLLRAPQEQKFGLPLIIVKDDHLHRLMPD